MNEKSHRTGVTDDAAALEAAPRQGDRYRRKRGFLLEEKKVSKVVNIIGKKYGRLTVLEQSGKKGSLLTWLCVCDCGNKTVVTGANLKSGEVKSCGCIKAEKNRERSKTHGQSETRLYRCWRNMRTRCENESSTFYNKYGGRGITVCKEWLVFENFYKWAMSNGYKDSLSIDRIDNNGNYCPENCRWVTVEVQQRNKSNNRYITANGETKLITDWAKELGTATQNIINRINRFHWSPVRAVTTPISHRRKI